MQWPDLSQCEGLSDHQREQLAIATSGQIGILGGKPGTGKTFCVAAILKALQGYRTCVAAPTGKAAVRVTESLAKAGVQGIKAKTIHSTLRVISADGGWSFDHNEENPLPFDFIFSDESSMIDTPLMGAWLAARKPGSCVLFTGDTGQLLPVGHGAPLRDMIAAGVPFGCLTEIRRNSGRIVQACHGIADGGGYHPICNAAEVNLSTGENLLHIERGSPQTQIAELLGFLDRVRNGKNKTWDVFDDVQILVPVNDKSPLGRKDLNKTLQGFLNHDGKQLPGNPFRAKDKIICTQNGMVPCEELKDLKQRYGEDCNQESADGKVYVANGEQARVIEPFPNYTVAKLDNPNRLIRVPKGKSYSNEAEEECSTGCNWELAYAISCHKSQGSEWPVVIVMIDSASGAVRLCTKEWLYTALSRGKQFVVTIGKKSITDGMCRKSGLWVRKTFLRETIEELRAQSFAGAVDMALAEVLEV